MSPLLNIDSLKEIQISCIGLILTGGDSKRFRSNKLSAEFGSTSIAQMTANNLTKAVSTSYEAGLALTNLPQIPDTTGRGPLAAISQTYSYLKQTTDCALFTHLLVLAADMPLVQPKTIKRIVEWPTFSSVVPIYKNRQQYLCARWSLQTLELSLHLVDNGNLKVQEALLKSDTKWVAAENLASVSITEFEDIDTEEDYESALIHQSKLTQPGSKSDEFAI
ncbi:MAG: NTP transferase domain-containing protein [Actinobacteria bacterium]|nr:NTP transferase domain-containing protein [Actinomycetota bacterium]